MTVGVVHDPWPARRAGRLRRYRTMVEFKANPRDEVYMRELFAARYPDGRIGGPEDVAEAEPIVLLYPDTIGVGWRRVERRIRRAADRQTEIRVLNGRGRDFLLDPRARRQLWFRRILETALLAEAMASLVLVLSSPFLLVWDLLRGHR